MDEKSQTTPVNSKPAWVQLYEARRMSGGGPAQACRSSTCAIVPRRKVGLTLSQGEIHELEEWQERFSKMLDRKISTGETIGILTRMCYLALRASFQ